METSAIYVSFFSLVTFFYISTASDTMIPNQSLNNSQTLISKSGVFELGFFSPTSSSTNRYLGIRYHKISVQKIVWVANGKAPITSSDGVLMLTPDGNLVILGQGNKTIIWSTGSSNATNPIVQLLDTGNLILNDSSKLLWQSFDQPSNSLLAGMKLGWDSNMQWKLTSWKSDDSDPSPGSYTYNIYTRGPPWDTYLMKGSIPIWRSGIWDGYGWDGIPVMKFNPYFIYNFKSNNDNEVSYSYELKDQSMVAVIVLHDNGVLQRFVWVDNAWKSYWKVGVGVSETYGTCGTYGVFENNGSLQASCNCLTGFKPRYGANWALQDWSGGCERRTPLDCLKGDGFAKLSQLKLPDTSNTSSDSKKSLAECRDWCLKNCLCLAYAVTSPEGGGCIIWFGHLMDIDTLMNGGEDLYLRLAASELGGDNLPVLERGSLSKNKEEKKKKLGMIIIVAVFSGLLFILIALSIIWWKQRTGKRSPNGRQKLPSNKTSLIVIDKLGGCQLQDDVAKDYELPFFDFQVIATSTNNFSYETKIGEGGFGRVHKGTLSNGQEIAVKRLSKGSIQGVEEFKNEIKLVANLQHKNLVRLLGCCIKEEERLLVYEYMPNKSLDNFLFDPKRVVLLDWETRRGVIHGVAQGLLYLHKYSRLRIIHRDLKCSNILLDSEMNPKISDFGIARIFGGNQDEANTRRVIGTYGYMPPEYVNKGFFSEKSDVFSFGVLVLEIVSGKKNGDFHHVGALLGYTSDLWKEERVSELVDPMLCHSCPLQELKRCVHVGLLCVQEDATKRPTMSSVVSFLSNEVVTLPAPNTVAFVTWRGSNSVSHLTSEHESLNEVTITALDPR